MVYQGMKKSLSQKKNLTQFFWSLGKDYIIEEKAFLWFIINIKYII